MEFSFPILAGFGLVCGFGSLWLVSVLIRLAPRIGLLDRPNERSSHTRVTPRGGGLGFVLLVALMLGAFLVWRSVTTSVAGGLDSRSMLATYLVAALFVAVVSLRDDFKSLSPGVRFLCQLGAAGAAVVGIAWIKVIAAPLIGQIDNGWFGFGLTVIWIVGLTNVYNFMDGIDGIAGVQGTIAGLAWAVAGIAIGTPIVAMLGLMLAGGCAGFLVHNWSPAKIFMGDVGSAFLGYSFAVMPLLALGSLPVAGSYSCAGALPLFALLVVWPFVGDGFYTFLRRFRRGEPVWKPHRSHLYQRLVQSGWSHSQVSSLYAVWCMISSVTALLWLRNILGMAIAVLVALLSLSAVLFLVKGREKQNAVGHV